MFRGIKNVSAKKIKNKITTYSIFQLFFRGQKSNEQDESQITEEFNVTNTLELHQELEKEPNLEYNYEEEEEEEDDEEENEEEKKDNIENNKEEIKKENGKIEENNIMNENKEEDKKEEKKDEDKKEEKKEEKNKGKDDLENLGENYMEEDQNIISTKNKKEENKDLENTENKKEQIIEEIDTTVPKNKSEDNNNMIVKGINPNTICHRLIPKGLDIDITNKVYFKCYKQKTKSNIISFITGTKKVKIPYIIILDENFYYMLKDKQVNENNENIRRVGNKYDLTKISNFQTRKINDDYEFAFEFMYEDYFDRIYKLLYFEPKDAELFFEVFQQYVENLGLDLPGNVRGIGDGEEREEEDEEGEEGEEKEENENEENEEEEDEKEEKKDENEKKDNIDNKEKEENNIDNKKEDTETNSTKEESKEIREVEITNQCRKGNFICINYV